MARKHQQSTGHASRRLRITGPRIPLPAPV